jgi:hypothetical protein
MADAIHAQIDVSHEKAEQANSRLKLQRSIRMAETRAKMAQIDYEIAEKELEAATIQQHAMLDGSAPLTPKEEQSTALQERAKYLDLLDAHLQVSKAKISLLRGTGELDAWLHPSFRVSKNP